MEQFESMSFSTLIAGIMLYRKKCSSVEIVNILSKLVDVDIMIDDENDSLEDLDCCIDISSNYDFSLKNGFSYSSILFDNVTVFQFLKMHTNDRILSFLSIYFKDEIFYKENELEAGCSLVDKNDGVKSKRKSLLQTNIIKMLFY
jgi:hypothetical protein